MYLPFEYQLLFAALFGLTIGSFLNVLILRLPRKMHAELAAACAEADGRDGTPPSNRWFGLDYLISPGSRCPHCNHAIRAWENIPVVSWMLLRGRCSACGARIAWRYPVIELLSAFLTVAVVYRWGLSWDAAALCVLLWGLLALAVIDLDEQLLPDQITLPLLWLGLWVNLDGQPVSLSDAVIGAAAGYLSLWLVFQLFRALTNKEGMGYGDFKLLALFGAWLGWQMLPQIILLSSFAGALIGISLTLFRGRDHQIPIPFGPYLVIGGMIALFWGQQINNAYLQISGLA